MSSSRPLVAFCRGDEPNLHREALRRTVDAALGGVDRSFAVEEFDGDDYDLAAVVCAAQTQAFLTPHRVVLCGNLQRFKADEFAPLIGYLAAPVESTTLVLGWSGERVPKSLVDALKSAGVDMVDAKAPAAKGRQPWLDAELAAAQIALDASGKRLLLDALGDDVGRLSSILALLVSSYGAPARLKADDVAPFVGQPGAVPPWDLTDAIDKGDAAQAVATLQRMLKGGDRHPLVVLVSLQNHVEKWLGLHGSGAANEQQAAEILGLKGSTFPAKKALTRQRTLGGSRIGRAAELIAQADIDLKGASAWPGELVLEVLVVRLARLGSVR